MDQLRSYLKPPKFDDENEQRIANNELMLRSTLSSGPGTRFDLAQHAPGSQSNGRLSV